ncbi:MAG TPA: hypothetical protein VIW29_09690 [Polyangiaceae bacterium]
MSHFTAKKLDAAAQLGALVLAFLVAAWSLLVAENGVATLISVAAGFALTLSRIRQSRTDADERLGLAGELELARTLLTRGAHIQALVVARRVAEAARCIGTQRAALETVAWCELGRGRPENARNALSWIRADETLDVLCCAAVEDACGDSLFALHLIESAARRRPLPREARLFWIDLCARSRGIEAACTLTIQQLKSLRLEDAERVLEFARSAPSAAVHSLAAAVHQARAAVAS